jgi:class 3 adenylate cyclase
VSRVGGLASAGEVLVSGTTYELVADSGLTFADRGMHELKGVTGARQIWAVTSS